MSHIHLDNVSLGPLGGPALFPPLTQTIAHERVGLFGRNGCGKSTLLAAIAGQRRVLSGSILVDGRVGFMPQAPFTPGQSLRDVLGVGPALKTLARIEAGEAFEDDFDAADWDLPARLDKSLAAFDLAGFALDHPASRLSGGEQRRVKLAALWLAQPDILLLDEPTNDLDEAGRAMVDQLLASWDGPALVASHDRALLEGMDKILELSPVSTLSVSGGWSAFKQQREAARGRAQSDLENAQREAKLAARAHQARSERQARRARQGRDSAARHGDTRLEINARKSQAEHTKARGSALGQERISQTHNAMRAAAAKVERITPVRIDLPQTGLQRGHRLIEATGLGLQVAERRLFGPLDLAITGPQRFALTGPNGCGKSSLLRILTGEMAPSEGHVERSAEPVAVLDQHLSLLQVGETALDAMRRHNPELSMNGAHEALAKFGFRAAWGDRLVETLSGGERVRLALACLFSSPRPPVMLILDEPTNHLDIEAIEQLEHALSQYDGALICVSHDREFRAALRLEHEITLAGPKAA